MGTNPGTLKLNHLQMSDKMEESTPQKKGNLFMPTHNKEKLLRSSAAEYLTFVAATGDSSESIEMRYEDENIWLTQKMMATLYDVDVRTINDHIQKIYEDGELQEDTTIRNFRIVQTEGSRQVSRQVKHYNLQMIIAVGFKVNNDRAVQFRKWANGIVKDYTIQGWAMDSDRLKNGGSVLTKEYFDHLLEQIRGFGCLSAGSTRRSQISMPPRWITTSQPRQRACSSRRCRTSSTGPSTATQRRN